jgi:hypothetical protein
VQERYGMIEFRLYPGSAGIPELNLYDIYFGGLQYN